MVLGITNGLRSKFESWGVKRKSVLTAAADLGDIYLLADDVRKHIEELLETTTPNWDKLGDICTSLYVILGEIKDHISDSRRPLDYLAEYCCSKVPPEKTKRKIYPCLYKTGYF